jgi:hypothetical protein
MNSKPQLIDDLRAVPKNLSIPLRLLTAVSAKIGKDGNFSAYVVALISDDPDIKMILDDMERRSKKK